MEAEALHLAEIEQRVFGEHLVRREAWLFYVFRKCTDDGFLLHIVSLVEGQRCLSRIDDQLVVDWRELPVQIGVGLALELDLELAVRDDCEISG